MRHTAQLPEGPLAAADPPRETPDEYADGGSSSPGLSGPLRKVRRNWQDYGWRVALRKTLAYLVRAVHFRQVYRIYRIDLRRTQPPPAREAGDFTFKLLTPRDEDAIAQIEGIAEWLRGRLKDAIAAGHLCLAALEGDRVAGFNLINTNRATLTLVNLTRKLRKDCAWSEHIAVRKEYRKAGLGAELRLRIFQELRRRGFRRLYGGTLLSNNASLSLARSVGFTEIADVYYRKFLSLENWRYKRIRR